jgi:dihydroflavonol-4-reductase
MEAVMHGAKTHQVNESNWSDLTAPTVTAYTKSKTLAERAAWDFVTDHPEMQLTVINPGLVLGTPVDRNTGSSISLIARLFKGGDPAVPDFTLPVVDLADVSALHVGALDRPDTIGRRYPCADSFLRMPEMAAILKAAYPDRRIPTRVAPRFLLRILALFDPQVRLVLPWLGWSATVDNAAARRDFAMTFVPARDALLRTAAFLAKA